MKRIAFPGLFWLFFPLLAFKSSQFEVQSTLSQDPRLYSALWFTFSAEKEACYLQTYRMAGWQLERQLMKKIKPAKPYCIVTDLDETVLDNSAWTVKSMLTGTDYPTHWADWEKAAKTPAFPGAVDFFKMAEAKGIPVFYLSNRDQKNLEYTIQNLKNLGLPFADKDHILLKTNTFNKVERRNGIVAKHEILMLLGDNLADFDGVWEEGNQEERIKAVLDQKEQWGKRFVIFPNPVYGGWKDALLERRRNLSLLQTDSVFRVQMEHYLNKYSF